MVDKDFAGTPARGDPIGSEDDCLDRVGVGDAEKHDVAGRGHRGRVRTYRRPALFEGRQRFRTAPPQIQRIARLLQLAGDRRAHGAQPDESQRRHFAGAGSR